LVLVLTHDEAHANGRAEAKAKGDEQRDNELDGVSAISGIGGAHR
jgi:hypothetical protein